jgi:DNA-binding transcriptional LysR family regulator
MRGVALTDAGQRLLPRAQAIDREARRAFDEAAQAGTAAGTLHVGVGPTPTAVLLPRVLPDFHARHPQVRLRLTAGLHERLRPALQQGLLDLALVALPEGAEWPGTRRTMLFRSHLTVVGRRGHPLAGARTLAALADAEWILMGSPGGPGGTVMRLFADHGLAAPRVAVTCDSFTEVAALLGATDWLALLPQDIVRHGLLGPHATPIAIGERAHRFVTYLVTREEASATPAVTAFSAMCQSWSRVAAPAVAPSPGGEPTRSVRRGAEGARRGR